MIARAGRGRRAGQRRHLPRVGRRRGARGRRARSSTTSPAASAIPTMAGGRARRRRARGSSCTGAGTARRCSSWPHYDDVVADVRAELRAAGRRRGGRRRRPAPAGRSTPGSGFAKTAAHNWALLAAPAGLVELGLAGAGRRVAQVVPRPAAGRRRRHAAAGRRTARTRPPRSPRTARCSRGLGGARARGAAVGRRGARPIAAIEERGDERRDHADRAARCAAIHGVFDFERRDGQDFVVDVELELDTAPGRRVRRRRRHRPLRRAGRAAGRGGRRRAGRTCSRRWPQRLADVCLADARVERGDGDRAQAAGADPADASPTSP